MKEPMECPRCKAVHQRARSKYCSYDCAELAKTENDDVRRHRLRIERITKLFTGLRDKGYVPSKSYENTLILKGPMVSYDCRRFPKKTADLARALGVWPEMVTA